MTTHKPTSPAFYFVIFGALLILTGLTVWVAYQPLGEWHTTLALGIALTKATLVVLFFMHVLNGPRLTGLVIGAALFMLGLLIVITMLDYLTRDAWLI